MSDFMSQFGTTEPAVAGVAPSEMVKGIFGAMTTGPTSTPDALTQPATPTSSDMPTGNMDDAGVMHSIPAGEMPVGAMAETTNTNIGEMPTGAMT